MTWDLFISHASEDKADIARPLADMLQAKGLKVWYDEYTLQIGDSLRRSIDNGLANSRYGVVILSPSFFAKNWTQKELEGLFSLESAAKDRILPVWHNVRATDVMKFSPMLAGRVGISTITGMDHLVAKIVKKVCLYRITDHFGRTHDIDVSECEPNGAPIVPTWLATDPKRLSSWLAERLTAGADLRLFLGRNWCGGTWFVVDVQQEKGEVINLDQLGELMPSTATTTTTPSDANVAQAEPDMLAGCNLSAEARNLLIAAAGGDGQVFYTRTSSGYNTQAGGKILNEPHNSRSEAIWKQAVQDLADYKLLEGEVRSGHVCEVTARGYEVADELQKRRDPKPSITTDAAVRQSSVGSTTVEGAVASLKRCIADEGNRIELHDLITQETERARQAVFDPEFPKRIWPIQPDSLAHWLKECEVRIDTLLHLYIHGCRWGKSEHYGLWIRCLERIGSITQADFNNAGRSDLIYYPALLLLYGGGLTAVAANDYALLNGLLSDTACSIVQPSWSRDEKAAWIIQMLYNYGELFASLTPKSGFPVSDYLYRLLRSPLRGIEPDDRRYDKLFDRFEYLLAISYGDIFGDRNMLIGRFGRQFWYPEAGSITKEIEADLQKYGDNWPPLKGGICGGSIERFRKWKQQLDESIKNTRRR